jgi:signal peptidase I
VKESPQETKSRESTSIFSYIHTAREWGKSLLIALGLALLIRHFLFQAYRIPSGSMIPNYLVGDQLIATKFTYGIRLPFMVKKIVKFRLPEHGEVVVFRYPEDLSKDFIKRTIALPGERIKIVDGIIFVNEKPIPREYVGIYQYKNPDGSIYEGKLYKETHGKHSYLVLYSMDDFHIYWNMDEIVLKEDEIFVMGDNRDRSNDSRAWGPVKIDYLQGIPLFIHFSWDSANYKVRWNRLFRSPE